MLFQLIFFKEIITLRLNLKINEKLDEKQVIQIMLNAFSNFSLCSSMINMHEMIKFDKLCTKLNLWRSKGMKVIDYVNNN
jgi:hypothetical protein